MDEIEGVSGGGPGWTANAWLVPTAETYKATAPGWYRPLSKPSQAFALSSSPVTIVVSEPRGGLGSRSVL
jgi:hypothetical protein